MAHDHPLKTFRETQAPPLTQDQLAGLLGVSRTTVARWETGTRKLGKDWLTRVSKKTGIAPAKLRPDLAALMRAAE
jgi:transcriptional regulator with XRE-family HTH domain